MLTSLSLACLLPVLLPPSTPPVLTVATGQTLEFSAGGGVLELQDLVISTGARLRFVGTSPVHLLVRGTLRVDGILDVSGTGFVNGVGTQTYYAANLQEPGLPGGPGGGQGGTGNRINFASSPMGGDGGSGSGVNPAHPTGGGHGGESGYSTYPEVGRHPGGGGGGAFARNLPLLHPDPFSLLNNGRVAQAGLDGSFTALGAISNLPRAAGGAPGDSPFVDGNPLNDFWGRKQDPLTMQIVVGELAGPRAGCGGGAGGNSIASAVFPNSQWTPLFDKKGSGGAGGGGLLLVNAALVRIGPAGRIQANGGRGGYGECTSGINCIGGGSGGGSGGMIVLQARRVDLTTAPSSCLTALGGDGGEGEYAIASGLGAGGDGGPGLIQIHVSNGAADIKLPIGKTLADMSVPEAYVLLPEPSI